VIEAVWAPVAGIVMSKVGTTISLSSELSSELSPQAAIASISGRAINLFMVLPDV
jgi:hypothetical protein